MELTEAIKKRKSIRDYEDVPVPEEKLRKVLEAARLAPSASNRQRWKFIIVREGERREELVRATGGRQPHIAKAPVIIAAVATMPWYVMRSGVPAYAVDLAIAVDHMALAATDEGLGSCWIGGFPQEEVRGILKVPEDYRVVVLLALGFSKEPGRPKVRKSIDDIVCYETFKK
ncbi:nitroreductase family protein [Chloroflexota bacterium]